MKNLLNVNSINFKICNAKDTYKKLTYINIIITIGLISIFFRINSYKNKLIKHSLPEIINIDRKPKIVAITYANDEFKKQAECNRKAALEIGGVNEHYIYGPNDIDREFKVKNQEILSISRGNGLWLWKSYFVNKTIIEKLNIGDYLIYSDAGTIIMNSSLLLIDFLKKNNAEMGFYRLKRKEAYYSKRDAFILMGVDMPFFTETGQYMAGFQIYRKSVYTIKFIQEWLFYCQDIRIVSDNKNIMGKDNYPGFIDNRHDQTVLSLLIKKYGEGNAGSPNLSLEELRKRKSIILPHIICVYRRKYFKDYDDLKKKCKK